MSANGASVVFSSAATNLVAGDTNRATDIFVRDIATNRTTRISRFTDGNQFRVNARGGRITPDGRWAAFLGPGDSPETDDLESAYRWSRGSGAVDIVEYALVRGGASYSGHSVRAANSGISHAFWSWGERSLGLVTYVNSATKTFSIYQPMDGVDEAPTWDVNGAGTLAAYSDARSLPNRIYILDKDTDFEYEHVEGLASRGHSGGEIAMSGDGAKVGYEDKGQVYLWNWRTDSVTQVSVATG